MFVVITDHIHVGKFFGPKKEGSLLLCMTLEGCNSGSFQSSALPGMCLGVALSQTYSNIPDQQRDARLGSKTE
jgi:hypothetical protein